MLHVLILAAGYGTRLRPITETVPKPLLPLLDRTLFSFQLEAIAVLGQGNKLVLHANAHHLAQQVEEHAQALGVQVWREDGEILGTGGPIHRMAQAGLEGEILVLNGDNWHSFDLEAFVQGARKSGAGLALLAGEDPAVNTLILDENQQYLQGLQGRFALGNSPHRATFTGISWYGSAAWKAVAKEERDIRDYWKRVLESGQKIFVDCSQRHKSWFDVGTPDGLYRANFAELAGRGLQNWIHPKAQVAPGVLLRGIVQENALVAPGCNVQRSLILANTILEAGEILHGAIAAGPWRWYAQTKSHFPTLREDASEHPLLCAAVCNALEALGVSEAELDWQVAGSAGSGRSYWRLQCRDGRTWVLQQSHSNDLDWHRFVRYAQTLQELGLAVPCLYAVDEPARQVLQEDLGKVRLWDHWKKYGEGDTYRQVLHSLTAWQMQSAQAFSRCPEILDRNFDFKGLRWETEYFSEHYLLGYRAFSEVPPGLEQEFDSLARRVAVHPRGLVHRDFQSHNIMVHHGRMVFIDFQGARPGSLYYDAASLLWDPYISLPVELVRELFTEWSSTHPLLWEIGESENWARFLEAAAQRLMQALGAYCNLSRNKGIATFASYIAPGEQRLREVVSLAQAGGKNIQSFKELAIQLGATTVA